MRERENMKDQWPQAQNTKRAGFSIFSRIYNHPISYIALLILSYVLLLVISYSLGYSRGANFSPKDVSTFVISKTLPPVTDRIAERLHGQHSTHCAEPVSPELVRQTIIDQVHNGTSPYEGFEAGSSTSLLLPMKIQGWNSYGAIYKSLIQKVRPKTIIMFSTFLGTQATYMANLTSQLGLKTQIICLDDFHGWPGSRDLYEDIAMPNGDIMLLNQFMQTVVSQNATESILPVPISSNSAFEKLCEWGILGDLIEVDAGRDFQSAWSDINRAYKLLRPGGVLFGHNYFTSYYNKGIRQAVRVFAQVNNFRVKADGHHWMINSA